MPTFNLSAEMAPQFSATMPLPSSNSRPSAHPAGALDMARYMSFRAANVQQERDREAEARAEERREEARRRGEEEEEPERKKAAEEEPREGRARDPAEMKRFVGTHSVSEARHEGLFWIRWPALKRSDLRLFEDFLATTFRAKIILSAKRVLPGYAFGNIRCSKKVERLSNSVKGLLDGEPYSIALKDTEWDMTPAVIGRGMNYRENREMYAQALERQRGREQRAHKEGGKTKQLSEEDSLPLC